MRRNQTNGICSTIGGNALGKLSYQCKKITKAFSQNHVHETCNIFVHILERNHSIVTCVTYYCIYNSISPIYYSVNFGFELLL